MPLNWIGSEGEHHCMNDGKVSLPLDHNRNEEIFVKWKLPP